MKAIRWPNGIGWDVDDAEVRDLITHLRAFVPIDNRTHKRLDVPMGTDPLMAVELCKVHGQTVDEYTYNPEPVPFSNVGRAQSRGVRTEGSNGS